MSEDRDEQPPPEQQPEQPPTYPAAPPPEASPPEAPGSNPNLGYVPGEPFPPGGPAGWAQPQAGWAPQQPPLPGVYPGYTRPDHPKATAAMVVGIIGVAGGLATCGLALLVSPIAWVLGAQARREIRQAPQQWDGESRATAGLVLGIIGTVLLVLAVIVLILLVVIAVNDPNFADSDTGV